MPTYRIETSRGTFEVEADRQPTEADILPLISGGGGANAAPVATPAAAPATKQAAPTATPAIAVPTPWGVSQIPKSALARMASIAAEGGGPAIGQSLGSATGPAAPVAVPAGGFVFGMGGDALAQAVEMSQDPNQKFSGGRMLGAGVAGMIPGASLAKAGAKQLAKEAGKQVVANLAAKTVETAVDEGRVPTLGEAEMSTVGSVAGVGLGKVLDKGVGAIRQAIREADNKVADEAIQAAVRGGYKPDLHQVATARPNDMERVTNSLVRRDIGLKPTDALTEANIQQRITDLQKPYEEVAKISSTAADALKEYKDARATAKRMWKAYDASANSGAPKPELLDAAKKWDTDSMFWENMLQQEAAASGKKKLVDDLIAVRPSLAKAYLADRAINYSRGVAEAKVYGAALAKGYPLDKEAKLIADTYNANLMKDSPTGSLLSRPLTLAKMGANRLSRTGPGQALVTAQPNYTPQPDFQSQAARLAAMSQGRNAQAPSAQNSMLMRLIQAMNGQPIMP